MEHIKDKCVEKPLIFMTRDEKKIKNNLQTK